MHTECSVNWDNKQATETVQQLSTCTKNVWSNRHSHPVHWDTDYTSCQVNRLIHLQPEGQVLGIFTLWAFPSATSRPCTSWASRVWAAALSTGRSTTWAHSRQPMLAMPRTHDLAMLEWSSGPWLLLRHLSRWSRPPVAHSPARRACRLQHSDRQSTPPSHGAFLSWPAESAFQPHVSGR